MQSQQAVFADAALTRAKVTAGVTDATDPETALAQLLAGTGLTYRKEGAAFVVVDQREGGSSPQSAGAGGDVDALIVTAQKREENIQDVPIAISAFSQEDLTRSQVAGGPDLMTQVPNFTFTKTNFSGYSIQIRGIGTQAISATTDAAVAIAMNNTSFIRNRFFEQEFFDLERVEVLRGPQGTLYGRNATAGAVNIITGKPKFFYEAKASGDLGNFGSSRLEGMINIPLAEDVVALRLAGAWTKRDGYSTNEITGNPIDGRDLWSTRVSLRAEPTDWLQADLIWEHFEEDDDRLRSGKQLCKRDDRTEINGNAVPGLSIFYANLFSQGCLPASLYGEESFQAPSGYSLPYYHPLGQIFLPVVPGFDPYASTVQSRDLRVIESTVDPEYRAETDILQFQVSADLSDTLTLTSETAYLSDDLFSLQDYNRFSTREGAFNQEYWDMLGSSPGFESTYRAGVLQDGVFCDPQIGCTSRLVAVDVSTAKSRQFSQEFRLSSNYEGSFNFSVGGNFLRYDTTEKYYVFINALSLFAAISPYGRNQPMAPYIPGVSDNHECLDNVLVEPNPLQVQQVGYCTYMDPNPIGSLNDKGHNYFLSKNPYKLISYAVFGEGYFDLAENLKLTAGLRWTVDRKEAPRIPSWILAAESAGYPVMEVVEQDWSEPTGRLTLDWKPDLAFTDESLLYVSLARGYKAGGSNPPPTGIVMYAAGPGPNGDSGASLIEESATKPKTFDAEYINAIEFGAKNTLLDGALTVNLAAFYYDYEGYQISQIVDRSAVNLNFDAKVWGLEIEADWQPLDNLRLGFKGGYENTRVADGMRAIDLMDRTAGNPDWVVVRPFPTFASNCILPAYTLARNGVLGTGPNVYYNGNPGPCEFAYRLKLDPVTALPYEADPTVADPAFGSLYPGYPGFNPEDPRWNNGEGFFKDLSGNELPNAPNFTATITADYTLPLPNDWLLTLHSDLYYQSEAWTRIFNTEGYDKLKAYNNINLAAILTNEDAGWNIMAYVKNVLDRDSITGAFLNSDDTGLTTNVFLTEPRLYGLRVTKQWTGEPLLGGLFGDGEHQPGEPYPLTLEIGGGVLRYDAPNAMIAPGFSQSLSSTLNPFGAQSEDLDWGDGREVRLVYEPKGAAWRIAAGARFGRTNGRGEVGATEPGDSACLLAADDPYCEYPTATKYVSNYSTSTAAQNEDHLIVDFTIGQDVGFGRFGPSGTSALQAGLRYARLKSRQEMTMVAVPDWQLPEDSVAMIPSQHHRYSADLLARRSFEGLGPTVSWDASARLFGADEGGHFDLDWTVEAGVLFGRQNTSVNGEEVAQYFNEKYLNVPRTPETVDRADVRIERSERAAVPTLGLSLGLSYEIERVKVSAGYRAERFFDVIDGGYAKAKTYDRTIDGPYLKFSLGFGG